MPNHTESSAPGRSGNIAFNLFSVHIPPLLSRAYSCTIALGTGVGVWLAPSFLGSQFGPVSLSTLGRWIGFFLTLISLIGLASVFQFWNFIGDLEQDPADRQRSPEVRETLQLSRVGLPLGSALLGSFALSVTIVASTTTYYFLVSVVLSLVVSVPLTLAYLAGGYEPASTAEGRIAYPVDTTPPDAVAQAPSIIGASAAALPDVIDIRGKTGEVDHAVPGSSAVAIPDNLREARTLSAKLQQRLAEEVKVLRYRANLNLAIGTLTTLLAIALLAWAVLSDRPTMTSTAQLAEYYVPRLSLALFIEGFAFFFLRLYKTGLEEEKYYQNELTNFENRFAGLETALMLSDRESLQMIVKTLVQTERNRVFRKGETTLELEKLKLESADSGRT